MFKKNQTFEMAVDEAEQAEIAELEQRATELGLEIVEGQPKEELIERIFALEVQMKPEPVEQEPEPVEPPEPTPAEKLEAEIITALSEYRNAGLQFKVDGDVVRFKNSAGSEIVTTVNQPIRAIINVARSLIG